MNIALPIADSTPCKISHATLFDILQLRRLEKACFPEDAYDFLALAELFMLPKHCCLKTMRNGNMVGFVAGEIERKNNVGWIVTLGVLPSQEGKGLGTALLQDCENQMGMRTVKLTVRKSNTRAIKLYERRGYQLVHSITRYYNDGEDGLLMEKVRG